MTATAELAQLLRLGDLELPTLSDDEIAALEPLLPAEVRLVPLLGHAGLDAEARNERVTAGEASLVERGLLVEDGERVRDSDELRTIRAVRDEPLAVTIVDFVDGDVVSSRYAYGAGGDAFVLVETVDADAHAFRVAEPQSVASALAAEIDPDEITAAAEPIELVKTADDEPDGWRLVEEAITTTRRTVRLYAVRRVTERDVQELETSLAVTPDSIWSVAGEVDTRTGEGRIVARRLTREGLVELLRAFL